MRYIRTENGVTKYDELTHDAVKIENDIIIGTGTTIIEKSDPKWVYWDKFNQPSSLKAYGENATEECFVECMSNYELSDGTNDLYYNEENDTITTVDTGTRAVIDGSTPEMIEANLQTSGSAVLKDVNCIVECRDIDPQSVIDKGLSDQKLLDNQRGGAISLIRNHDEAQDLEVFNLIKDIDLTGANYSTLVALVVGV